MSIMYLLHVNLGIKYTDNNVKYLLKSFDAYKCIFLAKLGDETLAAGSYFLTLEQAAIKILTATEEIKYLCEDTLFIKYKDTYFDYRINKEKNEMLSFAAFAFSCPWSKNFLYGSEEHKIDFTRYIHLMLNITDFLVVLNVEMSSDHSEEWISAIKNYVGVVVFIGCMENSEQSCLMVGIKSSIARILFNGRENNIIFYDECFKERIESIVQKLYNIIKIESVLYLYAKKNEVPFKIQIQYTGRGSDYVSVYPLKPYKMKQGYGSDETKIDVAFYTERLLELCENFAIYEFKTFFD